MPYDDFHRFLGTLRDAGELDIDRPIALNDASRAMKHSYARQGPALSITNNGTDLPLVIGCYANSRKAMIALENTKANISYMPKLSGPCG